MKTIAFAAAVAALILPGAALAQDATVSVTFNTAQTGGYVMVALYDSADAYEGGAPVRAERVAVRGGSAAIAFDGLPAGDYAIKSFHDVNGDGEMNTNPFGMPVEPFAFSNNAVGNMGPARWDRAHFAASGATSQIIDLK